MKKILFAIIAVTFLHVGCKPKKEGQERTKLENGLSNSSQPKDDSNVRDVTGSRNQGKSKEQFDSFGGSSQAFGSGEFDEQKMLDSGGSVSTELMQSQMGQRGQYEVYYKTLPMRTSLGRELNIQVWQPVNKKTTNKEAHYIVAKKVVKLSINGKIAHWEPPPGFFKEFGETIADGVKNIGGKIADGLGGIFLTNTAESQSFPVIVFSHGNTGSGSAMALTHEWLATHGYLILSINHNGDNIQNVFDGNLIPHYSKENFENREDDVLSLLLDLEKADSLLASKLQNVDKDNIFLMGESFGGYTVTSSILSKIKNVRGIIGIVPALTNGPSLLTESFYPCLFVTSGLDTQVPPPETESILNRIENAPVWHAYFPKANHLHFNYTKPLGDKLKLNLKLWNLFKSIADFDLLLKMYREIDDPNTLDFHRGQVLVNELILGFMNFHIGKTDRSWAISREFSSLNPEFDLRIYNYQN